MTSFYVLFIIVHFSLVVDILLLYDGCYREPTVPAPRKKQTTPPSIPITELYSGCNYPVGLEMPYTVSYICMYCMYVIRK